jgi:transcriptional regulator with XRE-family HTH domain
MNLYKYIGEKIRELRQLNSLSQDDLARKIEVPTNTISRWETATYKPSAVDLEKLADTLNVAISYFFPEAEQPNLSANLQALLSASAELDDHDLQELTAYAKFRKARAVLNASKNKGSK